MTVYVTEHAGIGPYRQPYTQTALASYSLTSASTLGLLSASAKYVRVSADAASLISFVASTTAAALTSTNAFRIPANTIELFGVAGLRIMAAST